MPRLLIVEDDRQIATFVRFALEDEGYEVRVADDGPRAIELSRDWRPDMVVLDMMLPGLSGDSVAIRIREQHGPDIPFLVVTADGRAPEKAERAQAFAFLHKPFDMEDLLRLVRDGL